MDRQVQLAARLFAKTMAGELDWKPSPRDDWYQASFAQYAIRLGIKKGRQGDDVVMEVINNAGEIADLISDEDLQGKATPPGEYEHWYGAMFAMYGRARRIALGADKAIDDILGELGD